MEENNKVVEMKPKKKEKLTYEELENFANQLSEQNKQMYNQLKEISNNTWFKRLEFLFKILENNTLFDKEYLTQCVEEIKTIMTVKESEEDKEEKSE